MEMDEQEKKDLDIKNNLVKQEQENNIEEKEEK